MILNKSSVDRGLAHALLYKTEMIDLREEKGKRSGLEPEPHDARSRVSSRMLLIACVASTWIADHMHGSVCRPNYLLC